MQTKAVLALLFAAAANAAPSLTPRAASVPISIFEGAGCNDNPNPVTIANVPTDGSCFPISPVISGNTDSGLIDDTQYTVPAGCSITVFSDSGCSSVNLIPVPASGRCFTFGPNKLIRSAKITGTC